MEKISIVYRFKFIDGSSREFKVNMNPETLLADYTVDEDQPEWTELDHFKCDHCPLDSTNNSHCPAAVSLTKVTKDCDFLISYEEIELEVITNERHVFQKTTAQKGISSLIGLLMATSDCPHTRFFKPMARFHLPLSSEDETIYRVSSMYALAQYFKLMNDQDTDLALIGLKEIYENIHKVNLGIANRLRSIAKKDASINALIILDQYSQSMPVIIEDKLEEIDHLFKSFIHEAK